MTPSDPTKLQFHYVLTCPCSETLTGDTEDEIVQASLAHLQAKHPDMADKYDRDQILSIARRLVRPT
jgi:hypothetical protein